MLDTPNLHLALGTDADANANWEKIDRWIGLASGPGVILPGDTEIQGSLQVDGSANIAGLLTAPGGSNIGGLSFLNQLIVNALAQFQAGIGVSGPVTLPAQAVAQAALAKIASLQGIWIGNPLTTQFNFGTTPVACASVMLDATEDVGRWELVIAHMTLQVVVAGSASNTVVVTLNRGGVVQQTRSLFYQLTNPGSIAVPITLMRFGQVTDTTPAQQSWSVWGSLQAAASGASYTHAYSQVAAVQFT